MFFTSSGAIMQASYLINHSLEVRFALAVGTAVALFAIVRGVYFIDEKLTAFFKQRQQEQKRPAIVTANCATATR